MSSEFLTQDSALRTQTYPLMALLLLSLSLWTNAIGGGVTRAQWILIGAVLVGLAIGLYIVFCPTECR